jgi:hypothetical protein
VEKVRAAALFLKGALAQVVAATAAMAAMAELLKIKVAAAAAG